MNECIGGPSPFPLLDLPDDLVITVLEQLERLSRHSVRSCTGVCHRLYRLGVPIAYRHDVHINNSEYSFGSNRALSAGSQLPRFAASAFFDDGQPCCNDALDAEPLRAWLRAAHPAHNLKVIDYRGNSHVSQRLLNDIGKWFPEIEINVFAKYYSANDLMEDQDWEPCKSVLPCGFSSRQVRSLQTGALWDALDKSTMHAARCLEKIINTCPNLKRLVDRSPSDSKDCYGQSRVLTLRLDPSNRLPVLEEFAYLPIAPETIRSWGTFTGAWQQLQMLKVSNLEQLSAFGHDLPSLRHLTLACIPSVSHNTLDALRGPCAPLKSLHINNLQEFRVPARFLRLYAESLVEISLHPHERAYHGCGFSPSELSTLSQTCPKIRRLCLQVECSQNWPPPALAMLSGFEYLEEAFVGCAHEDAVGGSLQSDEACLETYEFIQGVRDSDSLWRVGVYLGSYMFNIIDSMRDWGEIAENLQRLCRRTLSGEPVITTPYARESDYQVFQKIREAVSLEGRPFRRAFHWSAGPDCIYWFAKNLVGGNEWAQEVLLPAGLLTQTDLNESSKPHDAEILAAVQDHASAEKWRAIIVAELQYFKRKRDFEAEYGASTTLYDVLYPAADQEL